MSCFSKSSSLNANGYEDVGTFIPHADEQGAWQASEHQAVQLAVVADCGHVHNWEELLDVVRQDIVEQTLIPLLHMHCAINVCQILSAQAQAEHLVVQDRRQPAGMSGRCACPGHSACCGC